MKGFNCREVAQHIVSKTMAVADWCCIPVDASRFDQHVCDDMLRWEHGLYLSAFSSIDRKELARLLRMQIHYKGVGCCEGTLVKYVTKNGARASGDMNTALGNCLISVAMLYTFALTA